MLVYEDHPLPRRSGKPFRVEEFDATEMWLKHYKNSLVLKFFHCYGTVQEKCQAQKEMLICERKLTYWERQANYDKITALRAIDKINKQWANP